MPVVSRIEQALALIISAASFYSEILKARGQVGEFKPNIPANLATTSLGINALCVLDLGLGLRAQGDGVGFEECEAFCADSRSGWEVNS